MKNLFLIIAILVFVYTTAIADSIVLTNPEVINSPTAIKMHWEVTKINAADRFLQVRYQWLDPDGHPVRDTGNDLWHTWSCKNVDDINTKVSIADCAAENDPDPCCTGAGTGTCDDSITCFTDVFNFQVRQQDVGTSIGVGLRKLIWNKMKTEVLTPGNDGTFE